MPWLHFDALQVGARVTDDDANEIAVLDSYATEHYAEGHGKVIMEFHVPNFAEWFAATQAKVE